MTAADSFGDVELKPESKEFEVGLGDIADQRQHDSTARPLRSREAGPRAPSFVRRIRPQRSGSHDARAMAIRNP